VAFDSPCARFNSQLADPEWLLGVLGLASEGSWLGLPVTYRPELMFLMGFIFDLFISFGGSHLLNSSQVALDGRYTIMRNERMVLIMLGSLPVSATSSAFNDLEHFTWRAAAVCACIPWAGLVLRTWYFDLCQVDIDTRFIGRHAVEISSTRAAIWSLLHLPLMGCISWVSVCMVKIVMGPTYAPERGTVARERLATMNAIGGITMDDMLDSLVQVGGITEPHQGESAPTPYKPKARWQMSAAFVLFIVIGTLQQLLHQGSGRGSRRCGKRHRLMIRALGVAVYVALQLPLMHLPAPGHKKMLGPNGSMTIAFDLGWLTLLAGVEIVGLHFVPDSPLSRHMSSINLEAAGRE